MKSRNPVDEAAILRFEPKQVDDKNYLRSVPGKKSIDYPFLKDMAQDYIAGLSKINQVLGDANIDAAFNQLKTAYDAVFGLPIVDGQELTEAYQDRVQQVADEIEQRSKVTPFTKEELIRAIETEATRAGVAELKFKDTPRSTAWKDFVKDVLAALKGKVKFGRPGVAASAAARKAENEKKLQKIAGIIDDSLGYSFPDGDPIDYIMPRVERLGIDTYDVHDWLDRAARKVLGAKSLNAYLAAWWDDVAVDNLELVMSSGAGLQNPFTGQMIKISAGTLASIFEWQPGHIVDLLSTKEIFRIPDLKSVLDKYKSNIIKSILSEIKRNYKSSLAKRAINNLADFGVDWPELATIKKSILAAPVAETLNPGDVFAIETVDQAIVGTVLLAEDNEIIIEGSSYEFNERERALNEAEYQGREVTLNKPMSGDVKKYRVYVKDPKTGNVKKVNFGDKNMEIKRDDPERRKSFRARHGCGTPRASDKTKAAYWSCKLWGSKKVSDILKGK